MVFSVRQLMKYVLLSSTILLADKVNNDQAAWLHIPVCARVGLNSKVKKKYIRKCKGKDKAESWLRKRLQSTCKQNYCYGTKWLQKSEYRRERKTKQKTKQNKKQKKKQKKKKKKKHAVDGSVRRSLIQVLTGFALLNFTEKTRALCFHPTRTEWLKINIL